MSSRAFVVSVILWVATGTARPINAQDRTPDPHVSVGAFWSANIASVALAPAVDGVKARQWIGGGLTLNLPLSRELSVDGRALWSRRGARLPIAAGSGYQDVWADYLSVPILLKASTQGSIRPYLLGGGEFGVRIRAGVRTVLGALVVDEDATSLIRRTDVSLNAGAGIERSIGKSQLFVEGLYAHGLRNVTPDQSGDTTRTRTLTLLAGVRF